MDGFQSATAIEATDKNVAAELRTRAWWLLGSAAVSVGILIWIIGAIIKSHRSG